MRYVLPGRFVCSIMSKLLTRIQLSKTETGDNIPENTIGTACQHEVEDINNIDLEIRREGLGENGQNAANQHKIESKSLNVCDNISLNGCETLNSPTVKSMEENGVGEKNRSLEKVTGNIDLGTDFRHGDVTDDLERIFTSFTPEDLQKLMVKNKNGDDILFCDTGNATWI